MRLGVDDGDAAGRGAVDVAAERCGATIGAAIAGLGGAFLVAVTRFGLGFCALIFVVRRTVVFAAGLLAFVVRLTSCFAAADLLVFLLALLACLIGRFATVALRVFSAFRDRLAPLLLRLDGRPPRRRFLPHRHCRALCFRCTPGRLRCFALL